MKIEGLHFSKHLNERIIERNLRKSWIIETIETPDEEVNITEDETHFYKTISEFQNKCLKVVINKKNKIIVTAYFDRNKKGKQL